MKTFFGGALVVILALAGPQAASAGELTLSMNGGRVTLIADEVPLRDILREWARIGKTTIVNGDKLSGPPLTLQLVDQPERDVLDLLLRTASGYIVAPRPVLLADASAFDRILIMPTSRAPAATFSSTPAPFNNRPAMAQPRPQPQPDFDDPVEPVNQPVPPGMNPGQVPNADPNAPPPTQTVPGMPSGTQTPMTAPRPGMLPPPPQGQPNPYGPQPRPLPPGVRPPGGGGEGQIQ